MLCYAVLCDECGVQVYDLNTRLMTAMRQASDAEAAHARQSIAFAHAQKQVAFALQLAQEYEL